MYLPYVNPLALLSW